MMEHVRWGQYNTMDERNGKELKTLLSQLANEKDDQEFDRIYLEISNMLIQNGESNECGVFAYPFLVQTTLNQTDINRIIQLLVLLGMLKTFNQRIDIFDFHQNIYTDYYEAIFILQEQMIYIMNPAQMKELSADDKTELARIWLSIMDIGVDYLPFATTGCFDNTFSISCQNCTSKIEQVSLFNSDKANAMTISPNRRISAAPFLPPLENTGILFQRFLKDLNEEYLSSCLPLLYGTITCPHCMGSIRVIDGIIDFLKYETDLINMPQEEEVTFLIDHANEMRIEDTKMAHHYLMRALFLWKMLYPEGVTKEEVRIYNSLTVCYRLIYEHGKERTCAETSLSLALKLHEDCEELARAYANVGLTYHKNNEPKDSSSNIKALEHYQKALDLYTNIQGIQGKDTKILKKNIAMILGISSDMEKAIEALDEQLEEENDAYEIADLYKKKCDIYMDHGNFTQGLEAYEYYLNYNIQEYGKDSDMVGDCYAELGDLCIKAGFYDYAMECYHKAKEIMLTYYQNALLDDDGYMESLTLSDCYSSMAHCAHLMKKDDLAFTLIESCYALIMKSQPNTPTKEKGDALTFMGDLMEGFQQTAYTLAFYEAALAMYKNTQSYDMNRNENIFLEEADDCDAIIQSLYEKIKKLKNTLHH